MDKTQGRGPIVVPPWLKKEKKRVKRDHTATGHTHVSCVSFSPLPLTSLVTILPSTRIPRGKSWEESSVLIAHVWIHKSPCVCYDHPPLFSYSFPSSRGIEVKIGELRPKTKLFFVFPELEFISFIRNNKTQRRPTSMSTKPLLANLKLSPFLYHSTVNHRGQDKKGASQMQWCFWHVCLQINTDT